MNNENNLNTNSDTSNNTVVNNQEVNTNVGVENNPSQTTEVYTAPPCASEEKQVINTIKEKKKTNMLPTFIIIIVLLLGVSYMDKIIAFFDKEDTPIINNSNDDEESENHNLVDGFIVIDDNSAYMKLEKIKFYNFIKSTTDNVITLNYLSDVTHNDVKNLEIFIEFYNAEKEFLYRDIFNVDKAEIDSIKTYTVSLSNDVLSLAKYAKVKKITKQEENSKQQVICRIKEVGQGYNILYKNTFNFINNELASYDVHKEINITLESTITNKYKLEMSNENSEMLSANIQTTYENNILDYSVDLTKELKDFIPLHEYKTAASIVKNKETLKKWECE